MSALVISRVLSAADTATRDIGVDAVLTAIRTGGETLRGQIEQIRNRFEAELDITGDLQKAKLAIDPLKKALPGVTWSGRFSYRASDKLLQHSGLLCADLDELGEKLPRVREQLQTSPHHLFALFLSPSGNGLKAVFRVPADASKHAGSYRAVAQHVRELTGVQIDESCKDVGDETPRGYLLDYFREAFTRYLPETPLPDCNTATMLGETPISEVQQAESVLHPENGPLQRECCSVAPQKGVVRENKEVSSDSDESDTIQKGTYEL